MSLGRAAVEAFGGAAMTMIPMSDQEPIRLRIMIDLADSRIKAEAAAALMGPSRRYIFRLWRAFAAEGASALSSRKRGRPSNRRHGQTFRRTVLASVWHHYSIEQSERRAVTACQRRSPGRNPRSQIE
jgi:hypothetical protein